MVLTMPLKHFASPKAVPGQDTTLFRKHFGGKLEHSLPNNPQYALSSPKKERPLYDFFERVYIINLDRRPDRFKEFMESLQDWPFKQPIRFAAIDGKQVKPPEYWQAGPPAWGCFRSHLQIIETCLNEGVNSVLFLEDDAVISPNFKELVNDFLQRVPENWDMLYLGGQHLKAGQNPPLKISENVYQPWNINRTHAYALQGRMLDVTYRHLLKKDWHPKHHIDHHYGRLHQRREHRIYCPGQWIIGQAGGKSDINGREMEERFWPAADDLADTQIALLPFVAILGTHSSGSSLIAGICYHLGVHLGNDLGGYYGKNPQGNGECGYEAKGLAKICEGAIPFPQTRMVWQKHKVYNQLQGWINHRKKEAHKIRTIAGAKYPQLCRMGKQLHNICGEGLLIIDCARPLEKSILSLQRRDRKHPPEALRDHQEWLWQGKQEILNSTPHLSIDYDELLRSPESEIEKIIEYLGISPTKAQIEKALAQVRPEKQHIQ